MTSSGRGSGSTYAESTKQQIIRTVVSKPGRTGGEIAKTLGLDRSRVNSFLYGEGKRRFGLVWSNWRWYPSTNAYQKSNAKPSFWTDRVYEREEPPQTDSVCVILSKMSLTNATLKIRSLSLTLVELAFSEDDYPALDERLQAELIMRKKSLEVGLKEVQLVPQSPNRWPWVVIVVLGAWVMFLLGSQKQANHENQPQQGGRTEQVMPER